MYKCYDTLSYLKCRDKCTQKCVLLRGLLSILSTYVFLTIHLIVNVGAFA